MLNIISDPFKSTSQLTNQTTHQPTNSSFVRDSLLSMHFHGWKRHRCQWKSNGEAMYLRETTDESNTRTRETSWPFVCQDCRSWCSLGRTQRVMPGWLQDSTTHVAQRCKSAALLSVFWTRCMVNFLSLEGSTVQLPFLAEVSSSTDAHRVIKPSLPSARIGPGHHLGAVLAVGSVQWSRRTFWTRWWPCK